MTLGRQGLRRVLVAFAVCLALAPAAQASTQFTFGAGGVPDIAVDSAGTAHVAWHDSSRPVGQDVVLYCRIPRGARACSNTQTLYTGSAGTLPHVLLPAPGQVVVVLGDEVCTLPWFCTRVRQSNDGGATFQPTHTVADPMALYAGPSGQAIVGPTPGTISWVNNGNPDVLFTNASLTGAAETDFALLESGASGADANLGLSGATPVVVWIRAGEAALRWRAYDGTGDVNSATNWTATQVIEQNVALDAALAGGPSGLVLLYRHGAPGSEQLVSRKFTGSGWTAPAPVSEVGSLRVLALSQDAAGRLHAVYINNNTSPADFLQWRTSTNGVNWSQPVTINASDDMYPRLRVAAAGDGKGFATWDSGVGPNGAISELRAVPLELWDFPPDTVVPTVDGFGIGDSTLKPGQGTTFGFTSSEAGSAVLTFEKRVKGLKLKQKGKKKLSCTPRTKKRFRTLRRALAKKFSGKKLAKQLKKRNCSPYKRIGEIRKSVVPGANEIVFNGRIAGRKLSKGSYRAKLVVRDLAGNVAQTEALTFRVIGKKKKKKRS
jgi:hypothetical protein